MNLNSDRKNAGTPIGTRPEDMGAEECKAVPNSEARLKRETDKEELVASSGTGNSK